MLRTTTACAATALISFLVAATTGLARSMDPRSTQVNVDVSAHFAANDLLCVNEPASGAGRFKTPGIACSSDAEPYRELAFWVTPTRLVITAPATAGGRILYNLKR